MKIYLLWALLLAYTITNAQNQTPKDTVGRFVKKHEYDTNYISKFGEKISVEPWISSPSFSFRLEPQQDSLSIKNAAYEANLRSIIGLDVNYRALNISIGIRGPIDAWSQSLYGKTSYSILKLRLNTTRFIYEAYYTNFKGFSDRNTPAYDSSRAPDNIFTKRPDINVQYGKLKAIYIFSHKKFSYGASYSFTERQKKTKGTALAVAHLYRMNVNADSSFFNTGQRKAFGKYDLMKHLDVVSMGAGGGYAGTFVYKKWFFSMGIYLIGDAQYHHANNETGQLISEGWRAALLGDAFLSFGYNGNNFYSGFVLRGDRNVVALPFVDASTSFYSSVLCVGFRFNPPKKITQLYNSSPLKNLN
jgi:hypothetical protein